MYLIFDTETTGLPINYNIPPSNVENWPRVIQIAWICYDLHGIIINKKNFLIKPNGFDIPFNATKIHNINTEQAKNKGYELDFVLSEFEKIFLKSTFLIGHNISFDIKVLESEFYRKNKKIKKTNKIIIDIKNEATKYCGLYYGKKMKWPSLTELHKKLFNKSFFSHNAIYDVEATACCFFELLRIGVISSDKFGISKSFFSFKDKSRCICYTSNKKDSLSKKEKKKYYYNTTKIEIDAKLFSHIHNHTTFSILSSTTKINSLVKRAVMYNMPAVGITDYGNMMGVFYFFQAIESINSKIRYYNEKIKKKGKKNIKNFIKGIIGCEIFLLEEKIQNKKNIKTNPNNLTTQVLLAKNKKGYHNLCKICSYGYIKGYNSGFPRVGKDIIKKYKSNIIAISGGINSEIGQTILKKGKIKAEEVFLWWYECFKEDFYVEILRHGLEEEDHINEILLSFSEKYGVKYIIQNNTFYIDKKDANAHDILLCIRDVEKQSTPIGEKKGFRFGFPNKEFYFKSSEEMKKIFYDLPDGFKNLQELIEKVEMYSLSQDIILPKFSIPDSFLNKKDKIDGGKRGENYFLKFLTYKGAIKRYSKITSNIKNRIDFELEIIKKTGYPGYFLIVQDFINQAKKMNISVGPGRGSVAGSLVAYCIGITNIDPIKYNLLFERFLNPDRVSLPDIDIDFDDKGREKIIFWVLEKYGKNKVAQIITYGTMAAKSAIRDTARVLDFPLYKTEIITNLVPNNITLNCILHDDIFLLKKKFDNKEILKIKKLRKIFKKKDTSESEILKKAKIIEGLIRNVSIHACGIIITPSNIKKYIPVTLSKDSNLLVTQFDNNVVEKTGLLKIDFLGLKTLTIIKDTINLLKRRNIKKIDFPLDDLKTYKIFKKGDTIAVFQYESIGMQRFLRKLKPDKFEDLIAMNALYRPGPLQYIPNFISRKHGREKIKYDIPEMEEFLKETYGITIYQEQVMLLAQKIANFSKNEADLLRISMGKKKKHILDKMKNKFLQGGKKNGFNKKILKKIWRDWEFFSSYAFNKAHSTCYAYIAFKTAYLKTHYTSEYMSCVLSNNMKNIKNIKLFIEECKRIGIPILGPSINNSYYNFTVNKYGEIRFGIGAIKGIGKSTVECILKERKKNGKYNSIFEFVKTVDLRIVNKKSIEILILSGAFDELKNISREQYFFKNKKSKRNFLEEIIRFGLKYQEDKKNKQLSIFENCKEFKIKEPTLPKGKKWSNIYKLSKEKEVLGMYITSHPLDKFKYEIKNFTNINLYKLNKKFKKLVGKTFYICGIISKLEEKISLKNGKKYAILLLEDYSGYRKFFLFEKEYIKYKPYLIINSFLHLKIFIDYWNNYNIFIKIISIQFLKNVLKNMCNSITIILKLDSINKNLILRLENIIKSNIGNKKWNILLYDKKSKKYFNIFPKKYLIDINKKFLINLEKIPGLYFKLH